MNDIFDKLLAEAVKNKPIEQIDIPVLPKEYPIAVVLCTIITRCTACAATYEHPNIHLLLQYKNILKWCGVNNTLYWDLPRKRIQIRQEAPACNHCFGGEDLKDGTYLFGGKYD